MNAKTRPRFDVDALRNIAGVKVFARGEAYYRAGQVEILRFEKGRAVASVAGTEDYRTVVTGKGAKIGGECSCPAFETWPVCKHMVATALAANAAATNGEAQGTGAIARIRSYLEAQPTDALVEMIIDLAERDPALFRRLDMAAATLHADDKLVEASLRKAITDATRTRGFVDYSRAPGWAGGVDSVLDALAAIATGPRAQLVTNLAEHAISRIERAIEAIDDSDGYCGGLLAHAREIHLAACRAARPDPVQLARDLFSREMHDDYEAFYGAAEIYADVLGEAGLAEYRRLAAEAWHKVAPRMGPRHNWDDPDFEDDGFRLTSILDFFAEREGDVEWRIALRSKDLSSPWSYLQLAEFCRSQGREDDALRYAEEGLWLFEDERPDERLVFLAVELLAKAGRKDEAAAHLWRAFEKAPSLELYQRLRKSGGEGARAIAALTERLTREEATRWHAPADLLIRVLTQEKMFDEAWAIVRAHRVSRDVQDSLARVSEATHPDEALKVYAERVEELVRLGGNPNYEEACPLVARMAGLRGKTEQAAYLTDLKERHRRKRNFMKLLG